MATTSVYLLLGIPGSGRRNLLNDLIAFGLEKEDRTLVLLPEEEPAHPDDALLRAKDTVQILTPDQLEDPNRVPSAEFLFVLIPGNRNPVDQLEQWKDYLSKHAIHFDLGRIITVVHCEFLSQNPKAKGWFEACIHFSDVVLLNHREGAGNKWVSDFQKEYQKKHLPCLIELMKKGGVSNPARILEPQPRRLSQAFDFWESPHAVPDDLEIEIEGDPLEEEEEDEEAIPEEPYFQRMPGGRRLKKIPDIREFLE